MSEVYIKEPATKGKVILRTTHGDLEIELWSTEAPKACRNFCQLILEGYYNNTCFQRVIRDFCIQGGDPDGSGNSCESIYGKPYPDEIHPRLKFRYRGMMGIASAGKGTKTNGNQFFIVLNRTPTLDGQHTLFAKVVGQTVYNLVRLSEVEVDKNDKPVELPRILRAELIWDPFEDLEPRIRAPPPLPASLTSGGKQEHRRAPVKNKRVLSFAGAGDDDDEDSDEAPAPKGGKSAHDLLNDPKLLKDEAATSRAPTAKGGGGNSERTTRGAEDGATRSRAGTGGAKPGAPPAKGKKVAKKAASDSDSDDGSCEDSDSNDDVAIAKSNKRQEEILKLKRSIAGLGEKDEEPAQAAKKPKSALAEQQKGYVTRGKAEYLEGAAAKKEGRRRAAANVLTSMRDFQDRLRSVFDQDDPEEEETATSKNDRKDKPGEGAARTEKMRREEEEKKKKAAEKEEGTFAAIWQEGEEESDANWLSGGGLKFHASGDKAFKMAAMKARENLEIFDPLAAKGNAEVLADARKKRSEQLRPSMRKPTEVQKW